MDVNMITDVLESIYRQVTLPYSKLLSWSLSLQQNQKIFVTVFAVVVLALNVLVILGIKAYAEANGK